MNNTNTLVSEQIQAEKIRRQYQSKEADKLEQLKRLDSKVKTPGTAVALALGIVGVLVMGSGMSLIMVWGSMLLGLALGIGGMLMALLAYPINRSITGKRKKQYAQDIFKLSEALMAE